MLYSLINNINCWFYFFMKQKVYYFIKVIAKLARFYIKCIFIINTLITDSEVYTFHTKLYQTINYRLLINLIIKIK